MQLHAWLPVAEIPFGQTVEDQIFFDPKFDWQGMAGVGSMKVNPSTVNLSGVFGCQMMVCSMLRTDHCIFLLEYFCISNHHEMDVSCSILCRHQDICRNGFKAGHVGVAWPWSASVDSEDQWLGVNGWKDVVVLQPFECLMFRAQIFE